MNPNSDKARAGSGRRALALIAAAVLLGSCRADNAPGLNTAEERESYSLGYQFGENIKAQKAGIDLEAYFAGLRDAMGNGPGRLTETEVRNAVASFRSRLSEGPGKTAPAASAGDIRKNMEAGKAFLAENAGKPGVVTTQSGLQYRILAEGAGPNPKRDSIVTVRYRGALLDGTEFENTLDRAEPLSFRVEGVMPGWTEALLLMKAGSRWQVAIPAELAYGERGAPPRIPPGSALVFEIELVSIQ